MKKAKFLLLISILFFSSCKEKLKIQSEISYELGEIQYPQEMQLSELTKPTQLDSMQDLSDFMDYVIFTNQELNMVYTSVTDEYKKILLEDASYQLQWAGQYGSLSHNFIHSYDLSKLDENQIGVAGYFFDYAFKHYSLKEDNIKVINYEYYQDVLLNEFAQDNAIQNLPLYQNNNGFLKVENSEQLFYATLKNYFPYCKKGTKAYELLAKATGILNRIIDKNMTELEEFQTIYNYIVCENTYDYESFNYKDSNHTDYSCYFLEGILDYKNAVCDGIVKALTLFCRLEGIEAYHIGAVSGQGGHAYCYVKIDDQYYLSCPTSGSNIEKANQLRYHTHTNLFMLTSYYTSSSSWDYFSEAYPEIKEQVMDTLPYDYYTNYYVQIENEKLNLVIHQKEKGIQILSHVANEAQKNQLTMQIELIGEYQIMNDIYQDICQKYDVIKVNNGMFNGKKVYAFIFDYGERQ